MSYDDVVWGATLCERRCGRLADCVRDGYEALCAACADATIEREQLAAAVGAELARRLVPLCGPEAPA